MSDSGQLFEYELPAKRTRKVEAPILVPRPPGWHLITNRNGVQGFHLSRIPDTEWVRMASVLTLCGITGRRVPGVYPEQIPLCAECVKEQKKGP